MAVDDRVVHDSNDLYLPRDDLKLSVQADTEIKRIILNFVNNPPNIPRRRYVIACSQMISLYRRMGYHPEKKVLCKFYENRIKKIIQLEKGKEK